MTRVYTHHRMTDTPTYATWENMVQRCTNPNHPRFADWGGRGVELAPALRLFAGFLAEVGESPGEGYSIDRIDNSLGYVPGNIRWAPRSVQQLNKRQASPFPGTTRTRQGKWGWRYKRQGVETWGGVCDTREDAFRARLAAMRERGVTLSAADLAAESTL